MPVSRIFEGLGHTHGKTDVVGELGVPIECEFAICPGQQFRQCICELLSSGIFDDLRVSRTSLQEGSCYTSPTGNCSGNCMSERQVINDAAANQAARQTLATRIG